MNKILYALIASLVLAAPPCFSQNAAAGYAQLIQQVDAALRAAGLPIQGVRCTSLPPSTSTVQAIFGPDATSAQITQAATIISGMSFVVPAQPNVDGFIATVRTNSAVQALASPDRLALGGLIGLIQGDATNPAAMGQDWQDTINSYGSTWLTTSLQTMILNAANANNIPLLGPPSQTAQ